MFPPLQQHDSQTLAAVSTQPVGSTDLLGLPWPREGGPSQYVAAPLFRWCDEESIGFSPLGKPPRLETQASST